MAEIKKIWSNMNHVAWWLTFAVSVFFLTAAFFTPPHAVVDASVLAAVGELFSFAALATIINGIERGHKVSMSKGDTQITVGKHNNEDNNEETI